MSKHPNPHFDGHTQRLGSRSYDFLRPVRGPPHTFDDGWQGISPFVTASVLWSIYSFLRSPDDYMESICTSIAVGGDVDTTAAMTGAISGALVGLDRLPKELAQQVNDAGTWSQDELVKLAHRYHSLAVTKRSIQSDVLASSLVESIGQSSMRKRFLRPQRNQSSCGRFNRLNLGASLPELMESESVTIKDDTELLSQPRLRYPELLWCMEVL